MRPSIWRSAVEMASNSCLFFLNQLLAKEINKEMPLHFKYQNILLKGKLKGKKLPASFTFMTWNIQRGYAEHKVARDMKRFVQDVTILQEVPFEQEVLLSSYQPHFVYTPSFFVHEKRKHVYGFTHAGQMTLSKFGMLETEDLELGVVARMSTCVNESFFQTRKALYTKFKTAKGTLGVYNIHAENLATPSGRHKQVKILLDAVKRHADRYVIIAGDFNTIFNRVETLHKELLDAGFVQAKTNRPTCWLFTLDHIFHSPNISMKAQVKGCMSSDHRPILAEVELLDENFS